MHIHLEIENMADLFEIMSIKANARIKQTVMTQIAFYDCDMKEFGDKIVAACREMGLKIHYIRRVYVPGSHGLSVPLSWHLFNLPATIFDEYPLPDDVQSKETLLDPQDPEWYSKLAAARRLKEMKCGWCSFKTFDGNALRKHHIEVPHKELAKVLYVECKGFKHRSAMMDRVPFQYLDATGRTVIFEENGDLKQMGDQLVDVCRKFGYKVRRVLRMYDPGLGIDFPDWWVPEGLKAGVFEEYPVPDDIKAIDKMPPN